MRFKLAQLEAIKSASQRALAAYWDRLATGRRFPAFTDLKPDPEMYDPKQLVVWDVEGEGRNLKFRALYQGDNVAEVFNSAWAGKTMEQVVPMSLRRLTLDDAKECVTSGCLVYSVFSTIDSHEQQVNCERLLMPFGRDDNKVEQILASLQLTSIRGRGSAQENPWQFRASGRRALLRQDSLRVHQHGGVCFPKRPRRSQGRPPRYFEGGADQLRQAKPDLRGSQYFGDRRGPRRRQPRQSSGTIHAGPGNGIRGAAVHGRLAQENPDRRSLQLDRDAVRCRLDYNGVAVRPIRPRWVKPNPAGYFKP